MTAFRMWLPPLAISNQRSVTSSTLLTDVECDQLVKLVAEGSSWSDASVSRGGHPGGVIDREIRSASIHPLPISDAWPFARLVHTIADINSDTFRFSLSGIYASDAPCVAQYSANDAGHFRPHIDAGPVHRRRRLSYVVQLTSPEAYEGGDLFFPDLGVHASRGRGDLVVFPSELTHVVAPMLTGTRHVIVGWVHGPSPT